MRDFSNGWFGLREYAARCGVINFDDTDDIACAKIKNILRDTLPAGEVEAYSPPIKEEEDGELGTDSESETEA